jgi:hypothetical protein
MSADPPRNRRRGSALIYRRRKTVALIAQQVHQLLISAVEHHPAHLRLDAVPHQLQLLRVH